ncbi:MAG: DUF2252 family protein [Chitinophagaceae bacterium]
MPKKPAVNNDIPERIKVFNKDRDKSVLQLKYKAMAEDVFRFFRGTCGLFYEELSKKYPFPDSPLVWACGDLHIENFGSYKGSSRLVYFDLNDFDEALLAPALWEICRLTASVQIAAEQIGFSEKETSQLVNTLLYYYRQILRTGKPIVIERETAKGLIKRLVTKVSDRKEGEIVRKRTDDEDANKLLVNDKLLAIHRQEKKAILQAFNQWLPANGHKGLRAIDAGFRIAGTGSIGVKRYLLLLEHKDNDEKKMLIDIKQAPSSSLSAFNSTKQPLWENEALRVISVQQMMQHVSPAFLSSFVYNDECFVVKEIQPTADKVNLALAIKQPSQVESYIANLGMITASAQLRSSGRKGSATADELIVFAERDDWEPILKEWAAGYAEQAKREYAQFRKAWLAGFFKE